MELRPLGKTGLKVSAIGLGTVKLGRNTGVKYPERFELPSDERCAALLEKAAGLGITVLDTARAYGTSEERLGKLMKEGAARGIGRDRWVIVTKAGERYEGGESRYDFSAGAVRRSVEESLRALRTDRVEVVLLHCGWRAEGAAGRGDDKRELEILENAETVGALEELKRTGKARVIGASTRTIAGGLAAVESGVYDVVMVTYNARAAAEIAVIEAAERAGVGVLVKKALMSGHIGSATGGDPAAESVRFALRPTGVGSVIVGTISPAHLEANARAAGAAE